MAPRSKPIVVLWPKALRNRRRDIGARARLDHLGTSDDSLTYTFHIREDANWSDGMPITSHDIKFVIDAIKSPDVVASSKRPR